jgi:error-prone DNA polymerase
VIHLHVRSWFSFLAGGSSPEELVETAHRLGLPTLALTDTHGVYGAVRFQLACQQAGIHPVIGAEIAFQEAPLVLLAQHAGGYANLCQLLTLYHVRQDEPLTLGDLARHHAGLFCLTGGTESRLQHLVDCRRLQQATTWLHDLQSVYGDHLRIEVCNLRRPGDLYAAKQMLRLAAELSIVPVASNDVRYASPEAYRRYDLLTCVRLGLTVHEPHPARPSNAEAHLKSPEAMAALIPSRPALDHTAALAEACSIDLLSEHITTPSAQIPSAWSPDQQLAQLCIEGLQHKYPGDALPPALAQLNRELAVIADLQLDEFFLVVHEVVQEAHRRAIRCAGRGSAANSIVAYLLNITGVDPLRHNLLFERFLHRGRKGTPDIDIDFDSERRDEIIAWIEDRFGIEHTAMTATISTFRLRQALREVIKALGFPMHVVNKVSKSVPPREPTAVRDYGAEITSVFESDHLDLIYELVESLQDCPRHLGLHNGGMVLSELPLYHFTPVQVSANGVKMVQFDKNDVEALGLIKLDVLGLRMFGTLSEAEELIHRHYDQAINLDQLPLDDEAVYSYICTGKTLGMFQIESQGQMHLIASLQPEDFDDLICQIALFRPGPLQGNMVHPFVRRRRGEEAITYDHPDLAPILADTYGVILFQEQILEIAHAFAGMPLQEADDFRSAMSKGNNDEKMARMHHAFVAGAHDRGVDVAVAEVVFEKVSNFVGYGFCRSHAAAFARTVYQSAWLKYYHPAAYMAAVMQAHPGMYSQQTLEQEAKRLGHPMLVPDINRSGIRFDLEWADQCWHIRKPLTSVKQVSDDTAKRIAWARLDGPFKDLEQLFHRVAVPRKALDSLARSGALDEISDSSRAALWKVGVMVQRYDLLLTPKLLPTPLIAPDEIPSLAPLTPRERIIWDLKTHQAGRVHPVALLRRHLTTLGVQTIDACYRVAPMKHEPPVTVAGTSLLKQMPPTARGVMFITLEDESGYIQVVVYPKIQEAFVSLIREASLIVEGRLQTQGQWRGVVADRLYPLSEAFGGYGGYPSAHGKDQLNVGEEARAHRPLVARQA